MKGAGLGLFHVSELVNWNKDAIEGMSWLRQGSKFRFYLPARGWPQLDLSKHARAIMPYFFGGAKISITIGSSHFIHDFPTTINTVNLYSNQVVVFAVTDLRHFCLSQRA